MQSTSVRFAATARLLTKAIRTLDLRVPGFRSPPRVAGSNRSVRWAADGSATISVALRDRPWLGVVADMIDGVVVANHLEAADAQQCRSVLWAAVEAADGTVWSSNDPAASSTARSTSSDRARLAAVDGDLPSSGLAA
jgi:hypothetical protein